MEKELSGSAREYEMPIARVMDIVADELARKSNKGGRQDGKMTNRAYAAQDWFRIAAARIRKELKIEVAPTKRQAAKYRRKRGLIFENVKRLPAISQEAPNA